MWEAGSWHGVAWCVTAGVWGVNARWGVKWSILCDVPRRGVGSECAMGCGVVCPRQGWLGRVELGEAG